MTSPILNLGEINHRMLIFGGPYSNLAATQAVLEKAKSLDIKPSEIICTGDVVAYCAEPEQTSQLIMSSAISVVLGNCEESLAIDSADCGCGFEQGMMCSTLSDQWYRYAQQNISKQSRNWMAHLPPAITFMCRGIKFRVIHGGASQINQFIFPSTPATIKQQQLDELDVDCIIGGHCGLPFGQKINSKSGPKTNEKYWLNAGVIGLPANDGTQQGWYLLIQPAENSIIVSWHRLVYPARQSADLMLTAGLTGYAQSLQTGLWPSMDVLPLTEQSAQGRPLMPPDLTIQPGKIVNA